MRWALACLVVLSLNTIGASENLKAPPGSKRAALVVDGAVATAGGLKIRLARSTDAITLTVRKGKKSKKFTTPFLDAMFEVVVFNKLVWVRDGEVQVAPAKKLAKKAITATKATAIAQAEADKRGIAYDGASVGKAVGVYYVALGDGERVVFQAVVGARSKRLLWIDTEVATPQNNDVDEPPPRREPEALTGGMQTILDEHNRYRAAHCAPALEWSDEVAASAQNWADSLRSNGCAFEHSSGSYGENLAAGSTGFLPPEEVVGMWYREIDDYDFGNGGFSMSTGHFTQVVWKKTAQLGCGVATDCDGMDIWVCQYDPPGNYEDQYDKNVLPTSCR